MPVSRIYWNDDLAKSAEQEAVGTLAASAREGSAVSADAAPVRTRFLQKSATWGVFHHGKQIAGPKADGNGQPTKVPATPGDDYVAAFGFNARYASAVAFGVRGRKGHPFFAKGVAAARRVLLVAAARRRSPRGGG